MVSGLNAHVATRVGRMLSDEAVAALSAGNIAKLLEINSREFGGFSMKGKDDDDHPDPDEDDDDDGDSGADDDDDEDDKPKKKSKKADDDDDDESDDDDDDEDDDGKPVSRAEYNKLMKRMKAADRRAAAAEKEQDKRKRAEKGDLENAQEDLKEAKKTAGQLQSELQALKLDNAFLSANTINWVKPSVALKLAGDEGYLDDVVDEEDGAVDQKELRRALKKFAKDNQYLVKKSTGADDEDDDDDDDDDSEGRRRTSKRSTSSGERGRGRSRNDKDSKAQQERDARRAPSLGRRVKVGTTR